MPFQPQVNATITIDGIAYRIAEHPAAPGMPYGQEGRQATVYQLVAPNGDTRALKVFKPRFRVPSLVTLADKLTAFADLPGLQVCQRVILTPQRQSALLREHLDLVYAVLMPWVDGPTWMQIVLEKRAFTPAQSLSTARAFIELLALVEQRNLAHCDLSGPNVLLPISGHPIALVDVEQFCAPGLIQPQVLPGGSPGYAHCSALAGLWDARADRFAGAVLIAEMLGWCDARVRAAAWSEGFFDPSEMQKPGARVETLIGVLRATWGAPIADRFEDAWHSDLLADCPTFGDWLIALPEHTPGDQPVSPTSDQPKPDHTAVRALTQLARRFETQGNLASALETYREAESVAPHDENIRQEIARIIRDREAAQKTIPVAPPRVEPIAPPAPIMDNAVRSQTNRELRREQELIRTLTQNAPASPHATSTSQAQAGVANQSQAGLKFFIAWVALTTLVWIAGDIFYNTNWLLLIKFRDMELVTLGKFYLNAIGIALVQNYLIRAYLRGAWWWIVVTLGASIFIVPFFASQIGYNPFFVILVSGSAIGFAQWFVLRKQVYRAGGWIVISIVAWIFGAVVTSAEFVNTLKLWSGINILGVIILQLRVDQGLFYSITTALTILMSVISGAGMTFLLRRLKTR
jgi:hypothetical protein